MRASAMIRHRVVLFAIGAGLFGAGNPAFPIKVPPQQTADQKAGNPQDQDEAANFSHADAARVLDGLRQALESNNQRPLLKLFDAARMPDYPVFRDQVAQFFDEYEAFQMHLPDYAGFDRGPRRSGDGGFRTGNHTEQGQHAQRPQGRTVASCNGLGRQAGEDRRSGAAKLVPLAFDT